MCGLQPMYTQEVNTYHISLFILLVSMENKGSNVKLLKETHITPHVSKLFYHNVPPIFILFDNDIAMGVT
jgi:hypothetical protein